MIHFTEPRIVQAYLDERVDRGLRGAETEALLRQARLCKPGHLSRHRRLLRWAGQGLIAVGERIEQFGLPPSLNLDEQISNSQGAHP